MNQRQRIQQTVQAPNGVRIVLKPNDDALAWTLRLWYRDVMAMPSATPLITALNRVRTIRWGRA